MSGPGARIEAQAKLNLYLRVLAREESGYHSIETIFHRIELADRIAVYAEDDRLRAMDVQGAETGPVESNLAYRAALAYQAEANWPRGFTIELDKRIPVGAGLGGGSADAAAVLRLFDSIARNPLGERTLLMIAASLGADVPFLASREVMALAWGRGERMLGLRALPPRDVVLVKPAFDVSSVEAYEWFDEDTPSDDEDPSRYSASDLLLITEEMLASWSRVAALNRNDFIASVADRRPKIRELLDAFKETGSMLCSMTGSGSTVFGVYESQPDVSSVSAFNDTTVIHTRTSDKVLQPVRIN